MKVLVIHNLLWAHYKSVLFQEIQMIKPEKLDFHVLQIARNEISRKGMEGDDIKYNYDYTLLFDDYAENISKTGEIIGVLKFIFKYNPDVINVTGYATNISTIPVILIFKLLGKKIILSNESTAVDATSNGLKGWLKRMLIRLCDGYVVFGKSSENLLLKLGADKNKIWIRNAAVVDNKAIREIYENNNKPVFNPEIKAKRNFIFVGRISEEKNILLLIRAFQNLKNNQDWGLIIVGSGPMDDEVLMQIKIQPKNIYKYAAVTWLEIPYFFKESDCLILPSSSEPWGLVVNEAMVCGLAIIASDAVGCTEDLVKENGIIVKTNSQSSLENAMIQIINAPNLNEMKEASLKIIKNFSVENVAEDYISKLTSAFGS